LIFGELMNKEDLTKYYNKFKFGEDIYHRLMAHRVREILLVSSFYDAFIFEQDGRFSEQLFGEYSQLNLTAVPRITSVPTAEEALSEFRKQDFDMVITMLNVGSLSPFEMAREMKVERPDVPIFLLLNVQADAARIDKSKPEAAAIDDVFLWSGDSKVFLAMIKFVEDSLNVAQDTELGLVRVILLVEDSIFYYSRFLPLLCNEMMLQVQLLLSDELNDVQKNYRMRTRPKILMAHDYEHAIELCETYREYLLCVISDIRFSRGGEIDERAGIELVKYLKRAKFDLPLLLQSAGGDIADEAKALGTAYIDKNSPSLIQELSDFIHYNLGFGDFIFRDETGEVFGEAANLAEFEARLHDIPERSLIFHSRRNDFSTWLIARGEIQVAREIRPIKIADFADVEKVREFLISVFMSVREKRQHGKIVDFNKGNLDIGREVIRISEGSIGGKGRGIAFLNALLAAVEIENRYEGISVRIPRSAFIGTREFDDFIKNNHLRGRLLEERRCDEQIVSSFLAGEVSEQLRERLSIYLDHVRTPLAVRSSGLLEDSQAQPFAGIYKTYMLPNNSPDKQVRLNQLIEAVKLVFASLCLSEARSYADLMNYSIEEERMAVIIQEVAGKRHGDYFYPHISGVAQSYNYYPTSYTKQEDGVALLALGLGEWVVGGKNAFRFCPRYPKMEALSAEELIRGSQREFYALDMQRQTFDLSSGEQATLATLDLAEAERHGVLDRLASVWDYEDKRFRSGLNYRGLRVITFADILNYDSIPLASLLDEILDIGEHAFGVPVEIEFAVTLGESAQEMATLYLLQIRPLVSLDRDLKNFTGEIDKNEVFLFSEEAMGNGVIEGIRDIVIVDPMKFDRTKTLEIGEEVRKLNLRLRAEGREYILIGPGRWGSRDRFLGIPVKWAEIDMAKVIVEVGLEDFQVESSQGTHFFHNIVATGAGYFNIPFHAEKGYIDWEWLRAQAPAEISEYLIHIQRAEPFIVNMFGRSGNATIKR